jgi:hypothetical protein
VVIEKGMAGNVDVWVDILCVLVVVCGYLSLKGVGVRDKYLECWRWKFCGRIGKARVEVGRVLARLPDRLF